MATKCLACVFCRLCAQRMRAAMAWTARRGGRGERIVPARAGPAPAAHATAIPTLAVFVLAIITHSTSALAADPPAITQIRQGAFIASPSAKPPPDEGWEDVRLPDPWPLTRPAFMGNGWYRFKVTTGRPTPDGIGFHIPISRTQTELYVNGHYAGATGIIDGPSPDRVGFSQLYVVPAEYLSEGDNTLHLRVFRPGSGGGISEVEVGPYTPLYFEWLGRLLYNYASYGLVGVTISTTGLFILVLWIQRRPRRPEYFYFGAGALVWGLHGLFRLLPGQHYPLPFTIIWHLSNLLSVALLSVFCVRFAQRQWPWFERIVWGTTLLLLPVFLLTSMMGTEYLGYLRETTDLAHHLYNVFIVVALAGVVLRVVEDHGIDSWLLLLGALSFSAPRLLAWVSINDQNPLDPLSLTPVSIFAFVFIAGWILVERFVRTSRDFERLNTQLELRVAEKSQELQAQLSATEAAREEAEKANLAKSRFIAAASHDLRQPLHALGLFASALHQRTHDAESRNLVSHINQSIGALGTLFNGVLDVSKLDAGAVSTNIRNIELQRVFDRIADEFWPDAEAKQLRLRMLRTDAVVRSDPVLLERILRNLVHNAIRYTSRGGVLVAARKRGTRMHVEVWDTGIGIAPEDQERVFDEFFQVGNPERDRSQGLGLGLAIVKRLSDLLGHPLTLRSRPGRGSVFRLSMAMADSPADREPVEATPGVEDTRDVIKAKCIAIIDDEPSVREGMVALLASWHCEAIVAADEKEAVDALLAAGRVPAMLIVDYRLRDRVVGIDVIDSLRARFGDDIPALLISGESSSEELAHIEASGLPLLHKPVPPAKLRSLIFYMLARSTATQ